MHERAQSFIDSHPGLRALDVMVPDVNGILRGKRLAVSSMGKLFGAGVALPASTYAMDVNGNNVEATGLGQRNGDPDLPCYGVIESLAPVPWMGPSHAQILMSMRDEKGEPFSLDPRNIVRRMAERLAGLGLHPVVAVELEFYLVEPRLEEDAPRLARGPRTGERPTETHVFLLDELDDFAPILDDMVQTAVAQQVPADVATIEYAPGQFEINLQHGADPVAACDHAVLLKRAIKAVAQSHDTLATFMAMPLPQRSTSGMHVHLSLLDEQGRNVLAGPRAEHSRTLRHAIGGLLATMDEAMPLWAPNANSYRRLRPSDWVAVAPTWGVNTRAVTLRVPSGPPESRRVEHRAAGADANPYLVMAAILAGVHHGIENRIDPGPAVEGRPREGEVERLSTDWLDALRAFDAAQVLPGYFGRRWWEIYSILKWHEYHDFHRRISRLEYDWFLRTI